MELHHDVPAGVWSKGECETTRDVGLSRSGRPVEDDLPPLLEERDHLLDEGLLEQELLGEQGERIVDPGRWEFFLCPQPVQEALLPPWIVREQGLQPVPQ